MNNDNVVRRTEPSAHAVTIVAVAALVCSGTMPAEAAPPTASAKLLQRELEQRDVVIRDLQRRIEELERRTGGPVTAPETRPSPASAAAPAEKEVPQAAEPMAPPVSGGEGAAEPPKAPAQQGAPAPGQVTVTEEEAERALERSLVATGLLLLPFGQVEVEPAFSYTRREDNNLPVLTSIAGDLVLAQANVRRNEFQPSVSARLGLPFDSQLEFDLPYDVVQQDRTVNLGAAGRTSRSDTGHSIGDLSVGLAKTVFTEKGWRPDLIARFTWDTASGQTRDNQVALDDGFSQAIGQLVALKRQDPLAFFGTVSYQKTFEKNDVEPGNQYGFSLGAFLATSPETSLQFSLAQQFSDDTKLNGKIVKNSDQLQSILNIGISSIVARNILLQLNAGVGLTDDSPDYTVSISLPIRFSLPFL